MIVDKLVAMLGFQIDRKGLDEYEAKLKGLSSTLHRYLDVAAAYTFTKFAANASESIEKISKKIGESTKSVQEYQHAATLAGESQEFFIGALESLKKKSEDVFLGDAGAIQSFMRLGISIRETNGQLKSSEKLLEDVADRISVIRNPTIKRNILSGLGISEELLPLLEKGGSAISNLKKRAGQDLYIFSEKDKNNLAEFNASFRSTLKLLDSFKNSFAAKIAPFLSLLHSGINTILRGVLAFTNSGLDRLVERIFITFEGLKNTLIVITKTLMPFLLYNLDQIKNVAEVLGIVFDNTFGELFAWIEDLAVYMSGGKSVIGSVVDSVKGNENDSFIQKFAKGTDYLSNLVNKDEVSPFANVLGMGGAAKKTETKIAPVYNITINANDTDFATTLKDKLDPFLKSHDERLWREAVLYNGGNNTI